MGKRTDSDWYKFQENIKNHFESLGASASTNISLTGVRSKHDIDVLVKPKFLGSDITWLVEAKNWSSNIPKEKVLAFLSIVQDVGADRGFLISNGGFQKGAIDSAKLTNITLVNFEEFKESTKEYVNLEVIKHYEERLVILSSRYWAHSKDVRKEYNLRSDESYMLPYESPYNGITSLSYIKEVINSIKENKYPINTDTGLEINVGEKIVDDFYQACNWLNLNLNLLDKQLLKAEILMMENGDFNPRFQRLKSAVE